MPSDKAPVELNVQYHMSLYLSLSQGITTHASVRGMRESIACHCRASLRCVYRTLRMDALDVSHDMSQCYGANLQMQPRDVYNVFYYLCR
jgi:hypothetical protein